CSSRCNRDAYTTPKKKQKRNYSGKKKRHTLKAQIVINQKQEIICSHIANGRAHDFKIFKNSKLPIKKDTSVEVDLGYVGIEKIHAKCEIPQKKSKHNPLTKEDKELNQIKASSRIVVEHINARIKAFQIFTQKYRNRRRRFGLRLNLICALINADKAIG
ncbi:MAG: transposase family protein, partial [Campylobacterota bacterium]|nr:transposase family protein [Campylobacterota bacterium]